MEADSERRAMVVYWLHVVNGYRLDLSYDVADGFLRWPPNVPTLTK